jgi:hypothetical protein
MPTRMRAGKRMTRIGWREAYDALMCDGSKWTLSGRHLLLNGSANYYLTDPSLPKLERALAQPRD